MHRFPEGRTNTLTINIILIFLAFLLAIRELTSASNSELHQRTATLLFVPIVSLLVLFVLIVTLSAFDVLA